MTRRADVEGGRDLSECFDSVCFGIVDATRCAVLDLDVLAVGDDSVLVDGPNTTSRGNRDDVATRGVLAHVGGELVPVTGQSAGGGGLTVTTHDGCCRRVETERQRDRTAVDSGLSGATAGSGRVAGGVLGGVDGVRAAGSRGFLVCSKVGSDAIRIESRSPPTGGQSCGDAAREGGVSIEAFGSVSSRTSLARPQCWPRTASTFARPTE